MILKAFGLAATLGGLPPPWAAASFSKAVGDSGRASNSAILENTETSISAISWCLKTIQKPWKELKFRAPQAPRAIFQHAQELKMAADAMKQLKAALFSALQPASS